MNRSLLLIVCDFLLLSVLALARFDVPKGVDVPNEGEKVVSMDVIERKSDGENYDYVIAELEATNETLLSNLGSDKSTLLKERDSLEAELIEREKILSAKENELAAKQNELSRKDLEIDAARVELQDAAQEAETLAQAKKELETDRENLALRKAEMEQEIAKVSAYLEKERQRADELAKDKELTDIERKVALAKLAAAQERMDSRLVGVGQGLQNIGDGLNKVGNELAVVGADVKVVGKGLADVKTEVSGVRTEVSDVRTGVSDVHKEVTGVGENLAEEIAGSDASQKKLLDNIIEKQPNTLNKIYTSYFDNAVTINLDYKHRGGFFGKEKSSKFQTETILLTDGSMAYALLHVQETPFRLRPSQRRLVSVKGSITSDRLDKPIDLGQVAFLDDPRILIIPVFSPLKNLREAGLTIFEPVVDPHVFAEAVVIDSDDYNFGQTSFTRDPKNERYVRMQRKFFNFLRGKFEASEGDLVFSKTGQVLGIMVNDDYAFVFKDLKKKIRRESLTYVGDLFNTEATTRTLASLGRSLSGVEEKFR